MSTESTDSTPESRAAFYADVTRTIARVAAAERDAWVVKAARVIAAMSPTERQAAERDAWHNQRIAAMATLAAAAGLQTLDPTVRVSLLFDLAQDMVTEAKAGAGLVPPAEESRALVYLVARDRWGMRDYLGFGCTVVSDEDGLAIIACPPEHAQWQAGRLASGMLLRNGAGRGLTPYAAREEAQASLRENKEWWL